jgi:hypothetical protein
LRYRKGSHGKQRDIERHDRDQLSKRKASIDGLYRGQLCPIPGAKLGGLVGAVVAVPLLTGAWEIVRVLWVEPNEIIQKRIAETPELKRHRQAQP